MVKQNSKEQINELIWYDASRLTTESKGWLEESRAFERFPKRAEALIPAKAWMQSSTAGGISVRFESDAEQFFVRWVDYNEEWAINQGSNCLPVLYVFDSGKWKWLGTAKSVDGPILKLLNDSISFQSRKYMLYLPLSRGVRKLEIGIMPGRQLQSVPRDTRKPIVFYGTSIIHGPSASRPGNHLIGRLERYFNYPIINLGLSGSAAMEPEVIDLVSELEAAVYVIDCLPNMIADDVRKNFIPAILKLRHLHLITPIIIVESITYQDAFLVKERYDRYTKSNQALREGFEELLEIGVANLTYVKGDQLLLDGDDTLDGTHPNDLGYQHMAEVFIPLLEPLLNKKSLSR